MTVELIDVTPRDGLQNEPVVLPVEQRARLIRQLAATGVRRIEAVSFVRDDLVPAMRGAEQVLELAGDLPGVRLAGLVLNARGMRRAVDAGIDEVNFVIPATDEFAQANQRSTVAGIIADFAASAELARTAGIPMTVTIAVAFGCPFRGGVAPGEIVEIVEGVLGRGDVAELALADTIGCGVPWQSAELFRVLAELTPVPLRAHFHDTRRTALANVYAALGAGVERFDAAAAGLGGCPFAPGAAGNLAMEDVAWMLSSAGVAHGVDREMAAAVGRDVAGLLGVEPRSALAMAGSFPWEDRNADR